MYIIRHRAVSYRNISDMLFCPCRALNVVTGLNAQGKTNLLESIFMLTGSKGFRAGKDRDIIKKGDEYASVTSSFFKAGREQSIRLMIGEKSRTASLNEGSFEKAATLVGSFMCVLFSPEHLMLIKGSPEQRRRFIDTTLCQISPSYLFELRRYTRVIFQKNNLLKDSRYIDAALDMLDVFDEQAIDSAMRLTIMRREFIEKMSAVAGAAYGDIAANKEALSLAYHSTIWGDEQPTFASGMDAVAAVRSSDQKLGYCTIGTHRDDLDITLGAANARVFGSQGQQRSAVLALKLAEAQVMYDSCGERPVLLLDDVMSELDSTRREYLLERLSDGQSIITGCDPEPVCRGANASVFEIQSGELINQAAP